MKYSKKLSRYFNPTSLVLLVSASMVGMSANATIDVTTVTTAITDAGVAIATVGAAMLAMKVGGKGFRWIAQQL